MLILKKNRYMWKQKEDEVKKWINEMLPEWNLHKPAWYSDEMKARIPDEFVLDPVLLSSIRGEEVMELLKNGRRKSRVEILPILPK